MENTQEQYKRTYDWLKQYQFQKGQSGNPGGRKKGVKSLKSFVKEFLENLDDEQKSEFLTAIGNPELAWKMAEGNPENKSDFTSKGEQIQPVLVQFIGNENGSESS